jgi:hypothetical protein
MTYRGKVSVWVLLGLLGGAFGQGCGASSDPKGRSGSGGAVGSAGKDSGTMIVDPPPQAGETGESPYDPLCGIPDKGCVPDTETSCSSLIVAGGGGAGPSGGTGTGGRIASGGRAPEGGAPASGGHAGAGESGEGGGGAPGVQGGENQGGAGESSQAGAPSMPSGGGEGGVGPPPPVTGGSAGRTGASGETSGGAGKDPGVMLHIAVSCQVHEGKKGRPVAECSAAGMSEEGSACFSGADCAAGLACVGEGPGRCRAYCCAGPAACPQEGDRHCTEQPLAADPPTTQPMLVPVCMPAVKCSLAEPYPCELPGTCSCAEGSACLVVRDDGLTSCVPESTLPDAGKGVEGKPCPCAWGFVCSHATNECVKLCQVVAPTECDSDRCQASPSLPDGWGTCVGVAPQDAGAM